MYAISVGKKEYEVELAESFLRKLKGLSFRDSGKMLFKFSRNTRAKADMMFLSDPLYLYFFNADRELVSIQRAKPWSFDPRTWKLYSPSEPYRYLLESFEDLDLEKGQKLYLDS